MSVAKVLKELNYRNGMPYNRLFCGDRTNILTEGYFFVLVKLKPVTKLNQKTKLDDHFLP